MLYPLKLGKGALNVPMRVPTMMVNGLVLCFTESNWPSTTLILFTREEP